MKYAWRSALLCSLLSLAACNSEQGAVPPTSTPVGIPEPNGSDAAQVPEGVARVVRSAMPDMSITEAQRKERDGRVYYDVQGMRGDGSEIELDLLNENGQWKVVEIQRDIPWAQAPESARAAAATSERPFEPVRVIESTQVDGTVIYELFAEGAPEKPALEIRVDADQAEVLKEEWPH